MSRILEDFTTYTSVDGPGRFTITSSKITVTDADRDEDIYVYKDKGVDFFTGNFEHWGTVSTTNNALFIGTYWRLSNTVGAITGDTSTLYVYTDNSPLISIHETYGGSTYESNWTSPGSNTPYYLRIIRDMSVGTYGTLYCYIYDDSARTNLVKRLSLALHANVSFRYIYGVSGWNDGTGGRDWDGYIENLSLSDTTRTAKMITSVGGAKVDTAQYKFGNASLLLDGAAAPGATQWLTTPDNKDFDFGANDFTLEGWVRFAATTNNQIFYNHRAGASNAAYTLSYNANNILFSYTTNGSTFVNETYAWTPSTGIWYHFALSRSGNDLKMFIDGSQVGSTTDMTGVTIYNSTDVFAIGGYNAVADTVNGWLDELRVSNNARYTANFTKPSAIFTNDSNTVLLIHCDGIDDATQFVDTNSTGSKLIRVVTVAGGGGGGSDAGGGGGAGGVVYSPDYAVNSGVTYTVTVGDGGAGGATGGNNGSNGLNSVFNTMVAMGGGGGAHALFAGNPGGCGGGGAYNGLAGGISTQENFGGIGYGFAGGNGNASTSNNGGGGGGAGAVGTTSVDTKDANGGIGVADADVGNLLSIASAPDTDHTAGGGGGYGTTNYGFGGNGGGGRSGSFPQSPNVPLPGTPNTGGGGGNGWDSVGGVQTDSLGGSGIVIVLYTTTDFTGHTGGNATGTSGAFTWVKFTSSGTLLFTNPSPFPTFFFNI